MNHLNTRQHQHHPSQQHGNNRQYHNSKQHHHSISYNDVFRQLLILTQLDQDIPTLIKLFEEQGLEMCEARVRTWSTPVHINGKPIPHIIFIGFMNLLERINIEAKSKGMNLFDLSEILEDIRN